MTVDEILGMDLSYAPPFSPVWDPVLIAARKAQDAVEADISRSIARLLSAAAARRERPGLEAVWQTSRATLSRRRRGNSVWQTVPRSSRTSRRAAEGAEDADRQP